ncbi:MAG: hypothetical protein Q9163_000861 [Psora crenata]
MSPLNARFAVPEGQRDLPGMKEDFEECVSDDWLRRLLPIIQDLMRLRPSERISASEALDLVKALRQSWVDAGPDEIDDDDEDYEEEDQVVY